MSPRLMDERIVEIWFRSFDINSMPDPETLAAWAKHGPVGLGALLLLVWIVLAIRAWSRRDMISTRAWAAPLAIVLGLVALKQTMTAWPQLVPEIGAAFMVLSLVALSFALLAGPVLALVALCVLADRMTDRISRRMATR